MRVANNEEFVKWHGIKKGGRERKRWGHMSLVIKQTTPDAMSSLSGAHIKKFFYNIINNFLINQQWFWQATATVPLLFLPLFVPLSFA